MFQTEFCIFLLISATREAALFMVLEHSIRGIFDLIAFNAMREYRYFELYVCLKIRVIQKKTEKHRKNPAHSVIIISFKIFER